MTMKLKTFCILFLLACAASSVSAALLRFIDITDKVTSDNRALFGVAHSTNAGQSAFVAVGAGGRILAGRFVSNTSFIDAERWHDMDASVTPPPRKLLAVTVSNDLFLASGEDNRPFALNVGSFADGIRWLASGNRIFANNAVVAGLAFNGDRFMAVPKAPQISYSTDAAAPFSWTAANIDQLSFAESFRAVIPFGGPNEFAACGVYGVIRRTTTNPGGIQTWKRSRPGAVPDPDLLGIASDGANLVAVGVRGDGANGVVFHAADGAAADGTDDWTEGTTPGGFRRLNAVAYTGSAGGNEFVAIANDGDVFTSANGTEWVASTNLLGVPLNSVSFAMHGDLRGIGIIAGGSAAGGNGRVFLAGTNPPPPSVENLGLSCAGTPIQIKASIANSVGAGLVTVNWFDSDTGNAITDGFTTNGWRFTVTNNGVEFTILPELVTPNRNLSDLSAPTNINLRAEAVDLRTGFKDSTNITHTVYPRPTAMVNSTTMQICNGASTIVEVKLTGFGPLQVVWSSNGVAVATNNGVIGPTDTLLVSPYNPDPKVPFTNVYTVSAVTDHTTQCRADTNLSISDLSGAAVVIVNPRPTAKVTTLDPNPFPICNGASKLVQAELTGNGPWNVVWSLNGVPVKTNLNVATPTDTLLVTATDPIPNATFSNVYTVSALNDSNCVAIAAELTGSAELLVYPRPSAQVITPNPSPFPICNGATNVAQALITGYPGPWQVVWSKDGVPIATNNAVAGPIDTLIVMPSNSDPDNPSTNVYTVSAMADHTTQCRAIAADLTGSAEFLVYPRPSAVVSNTTTTICNGGTTAVHATLRGTGPWQVVWSSNGVAVATNNGVIGPTDTLLVSPYNPDPKVPFTNVYTVSAVTDHTTQCRAVAADLMSNAVVIVNPTLSAPTGTNQAGPAGVPVTLTAGVPTGVTVDWYDATNGGTRLAMGTNSFMPTNLDAGIYVYYAEARDVQLGCLSSNRTAVTLTLEETLAASLVGTNIALSWFGDYNLETTTTLTNTPIIWTPLTNGAAGSNNAVSYPATNQVRFFRLRKP